MGASLYPDQRIELQSVDVRGWVILALWEEGATEPSGAEWGTLPSHPAGSWKLASYLRYGTSDPQLRDSPEHPEKNTHAVNHWKISNFPPQDKDKRLRVTTDSGVLEHSLL